MSDLRKTCKRPLRSLRGGLLPHHNLHAKRRRQPPNPLRPHHWPREHGSAVPGHTTRTPRSVLPHRRGGAAIRLDQMWEDRKADPRCSRRPSRDAPRPVPDAMPADRVESSSIWSMCGKGLKMRSCPFQPIFPRFGARCRRRGNSIRVPFVATACTDMQMRDEYGDGSHVEECVDATMAGFPHALSFMRRYGR